jgi:hypothetical protein
VSFNEALKCLYILGNVGICSREWFIEMTKQIVSKTWAVSFVSWKHQQLPDMSNRRRQGTSMACFQTLSLNLKCYWQWWLLIAKSMSHFLRGARDSVVG